MTLVNQRHSQDPQQVPHDQQEHEPRQRNNTHHDRLSKAIRQRSAQQGGPRGARRDDGR